MSCGEDGCVAALTLSLERMSVSADGAIISPPTMTPFPKPVELFDCGIVRQGRPSRACVSKAGKPTGLPVRDTCTHDHRFGDSQR